MTKSKVLLLVITLLLPATICAADYPWLTFLMSDDTCMSVAADNLSINYTDGTLLLSSATVNQELPVTRIKSMQFTTQAAGIGSVTFTPDGAADYFTPAGVKAGTFSSPDEARKALPPGAYIVKAGNGTIKLIF